MKKKNIMIYLSTAIVLCGLVCSQSQERPDVTVKRAEGAVGIIGFEGGEGGPEFLHVAGN